MPLRRILNPTGFGTSHAIATNATPEGRAMNRRSEVRVLVNQARRPYLGRGTGARDLSDGRGPSIVVLDTLPERDAAPPPDIRSGSSQAVELHRGGGADEDHEA